MKQIAADKLAECNRKKCWPEESEKFLKASNLRSNKHERLHGKVLKIRDLEHGVSKQLALS